jgi:hypothetical protein
MESKTSQDPFFKNLSSKAEEELAELAKRLENRVHIEEVTPVESAEQKLELVDDMERQPSTSAAKADAPESHLSQELKRLAAIETHPLLSGRSFLHH